MTEPLRINWFYIGRGLRGEPLEEDGNVELSVDLTDLGDEFETAMRFPEHLLVGTLAGQPNPAEVPLGALYSADDGIVYQSDGTTWTAWAAGGGTGPGSLVWVPLFDSPDGTAVLDTDHNVIVTHVPIA